MSSAVALLPRTGPQNAPESISERLKFKNFLEGACLQTPLAAVHFARSTIHVYVAVYKHLQTKNVAYGLDEPSVPVYVRFGNPDLFKFVPKVSYKHR